MEFSYSEFTRRLNVNTKLAVTDHRWGSHRSNSRAAWLADFIFRETWIQEIILRDSWPEGFA